MVSGESDPPASQSPERNPLDQLIEVRISIHVPGELMTNGQDSIVSHVTVLNLDEVQMRDLETNIPPVLERINYLLCLALCVP